MVRHLTAAALGRAWKTHSVELVFTDQAVCTPLAQDAELPQAWRDARVGTRLYAEADGELAGGLPVKLSMEPDALTLLMPRR